MENTTKVNAFGFSGSKIIYILVLTISTCIISRSPLMGESFICGISLIAYMLSKSSLNIYLVIPAAAGLLPYISKGYDPWGYIAAMVICGLVFVSIRKIHMMLWQRGLMAASVSITVMSIYSLATAQVYLTSPQLMISEGLIIFLLTIVFDVVYETCIDAVQGSYSKQLTLAAFITTVLLIINGMGLSFLIWFVVIFVSLWALVCIDEGDAFFILAAGSVLAALMGHEQWGLMATIAIGLLAASFAKGQSALLMALIFACVCWFCGSIDSGVVLGIDKYCLALPTILFVVLYWRFGSLMKKVICILSGRAISYTDEADDYADVLLKDRVVQMKKLSELYSTYLDNRSLLAGQFDMMSQMLDDVRWRIMGKAGRVSSGKIEMKIAISQCAASGNINGDCCGWQELDDGRIVMVVSDGMGKGKKAAAESLMVTKTMIGLLKAGVSTDMALKMINTIMMIKDNEDSYATLDMVIVDKHTSKAKFYKIGAAPTLIRRKSNVEEVKLSAVPLGIVNGIKVKYVEAALKKDDWIIMMSDGISDGAESRISGALHNIKETTAKVRSADPQTMGDLILNRAIDGYMGKERDDMTVMVARVL